MRFHGHPISWLRKHKVDPKLSVAAVLIVNGGRWVGDWVAELWGSGNSRVLTYSLQEEMNWIETRGLDRVSMAGGGRSTAASLELRFLLFGIFRKKRSGQDFFLIGWSLRVDNRK